MMRYYPLILLLICLIVTSIAWQGALLLLILLLLFFTNKNAQFSKKKWLGISAIIGFIILGTLPLLLTQLQGSEDRLVRFTHSWGISHTSLQLFGLIFLRCINGYLSLLLFTSITPLHKLLIAMRSSNLPKVLTELTEMIYRFVYILLEKAEQVLTAQKSRLGYFRFDRRLAHSGMLLSRTLVLAAQDSDTLYDSMLARGLYEGDEDEVPLAHSIEIPDQSSSPLIEVKGISFLYEEKQSTILKGLNLSIHRGEKIALMGANGAGKSTLMRILSGLVKPQSGQLALSGQSLLFNKSGMKQLRKNVGIVFQNADLQLFSPTVWEEIAFGLRNMGLSGGDLDEKVEQTLRNFDLKDVAQCPPHCLSGGQKRWVTLAAVEAMSPQIILLDEPFTGLDGYFIERLNKLLERWQEEGKTLIIATHDSVFARKWSSRILLLNEGILILDSTPEQFFSHSEILNNAHITIPASYLTQDGSTNSPAFLPIFLPARKVKAAIVGGGEGAYRKALSLSQMDVSFDVISPTLLPELDELLGKIDGIHIARDYRPGDLKRYSLAVLATGDLSQEQRMIDECEQYRVLYNCISEPILSTFQFGASSIEKGIEVAIHTQYQVPHLGQILRHRMVKEVLQPLDESLLQELAQVRRQMITSKRLGSIDYEALKEKYERLKDQI